MMTGNPKNETTIIQGEFFSDGKTFVFRLAGTPLSGVGATASAAFDDLMRIDAETAPLSTLILERARDLEGETVRATIVRTAMIGLIVFAVLGGAIVATAALVPRVVSDVGSLALTRLVKSVDNMTPEQEAELSRVAARINTLLGREGPASGCAKKPAGQQP